MKLKVDPSLLADLQNPEESGPVPDTRRLPGTTKLGSMLPNSSGSVLAHCNKSVRVYRVGKEVECR